MRETDGKGTIRTGTIQYQRRARPYDKNRHVVCMDEKPYQLLSHTVKPPSMEAGNSLNARTWQLAEHSGDRSVRDGCAMFGAKVRSQLAIPGCGAFRMAYWAQRVSKRG